MSDRQRGAGEVCEDWLAAYLDGAELSDRGRAAVALLDRGQARFVSGEQSNQSAIIPGRDGAGAVIVKALRDPRPGPHPDVDLPLALWRAGWRRIPEPYGVARDAHGTVLAIVSAFLPGADDGFELACGLAAAGRPFDSVRDLGATIREMHAVLRGLTPPDPARALRDGSAPAQNLAERLAARAAWARRLVPELGVHRDAIAATLNDVAALPALPAAQLIHGDLHLGQTLHTADGWYVLDFEGEPLVPLAERMRPDQPERDVAGMLRSLDYASDIGHARDGWREAATESFLAGYGPLPQPAGPVLLRAFTLDKAIYECVYESENRPDWLPIPLAAVTRLL